MSSQETKIDFTKFDLEAYVDTKAERDERRSRDGDAWYKCCFHEEKTASLRVSDKQLFYCHGCGAGGGILDFVKRVNDIDTKEAVQFIAEHSGQESVIIEQKEKVPIPFQAPAEDVIDAIYSYLDGFVLKYKLKDKRYLWTHYEDNEWWNGKGNKEVGLYAPKGLQGLVVLAEGEKDADTLCELGYNGASAPNGTYKWDDYYTEQLRNADRIVILNDNDDRGIKGANECLGILVRAGFKVKGISPLKIQPNDIKGYDITDVVEEIGSEETIARLNVLIEHEGNWFELAKKEVEVVEAEVVWQSGLGEEYDNLIEKAVQETLLEGYASALTESEMKKVADSVGVGIKVIRKDIERLVEEQKSKNQVTNVKSEIVKIKDLGMEIDISGSGYSVQPQSGAIWDSNGHEVIGHFLSFAGIVIDAESTQDTNVKIALAYNTPQNLSKTELLVLPKKKLATTRDIIELSGYNINITQANALSVVQYLQDLQNHFQERTIIMKSLSRFGWYNDKLMPYEQETEGVVFDSTVAQPVADKLLAKNGEREESFKLLKEIAQYSESTATMLGAAIGSLILSYINEGGNQSFALNVWNETATGKSLTSQAIASFFGYPFKDGWWADGNATLNKDIYHNALMGNLPTFIDDPARNRGMDSNQKRDYVFSATSGQGRGRMTRSGDIPRDVREWCNIMIMTNETVFIDDSIEDGGARSRCLEIQFQKPLDRKTINRWVEIMSKHYGHFAVEFANIIRSYEKHTLREILKKNVDWFGNRGADGKRANNAAIIATSLIIISDAMGLEALEVQEWLAKQIRGGSPLSDGQRGYIKLMEQIESRVGVFRQIVDRDGVYIGSFGYAASGAKVLNLPYTTIKKFAKDGGYNQDSMLVYGYNHNHMVAKFNESGQPLGIPVKNSQESMNVIQVFYDWQGRQSNSDVDYRTLKVVDEEGDYIE